MEVKNTIQIKHEKEYEMLFIIRELSVLFAEISHSDRLKAICNLTEKMIKEVSEDVVI